MTGLCAFVALRKVCPKRCLEPSLQVNSFARRTGSKVPDTFSDRRQQRRGNHATLSPMPLWDRIPILSAENRQDWNPIPQPLRADTPGCADLWLFWSGFFAGLIEH